uniref:Wip1 n=1 Tax=Arundo donax TaxID=35708 RepID=A0A0A8ZI22_ARUDO
MPSVSATPSTSTQASSSAALTATSPSRGSTPATTS